MCFPEIPVVFHNGSNYDYNVIIKKLANEFKDNLNVWCNFSLVALFSLKVTRCL